MEACEYCKSHESVMWDLEAGFICATCHDKRQAIARQKAIDDEEAEERAKRDRWLFFHE